MENQVDSESYWNRSASKAFSFDDNGDDSTDFALKTVSNRGGAVLSYDTISEASFDNSVSAVNLSIKSIISEEALKTVLQEQTLDNRLIAKGVTPTEELKLLRRQIQKTLYTPSPEATAQQLLLGKSVALEAFRSMHDKQQLLNAVLQNGGGDAVLRVVLFLRRSLNAQNFHKILQQQPKALQHYVSYLKERHVHEAQELLQLFGKIQEAFMLDFKAALKCQDLQVRKQKLRQLLERYGSQNLNGGVITVHQQIFHSALKLLEVTEKERNALDNFFDHNSTPIDVLYACCRKHTNWKEQDLVRSSSPFRLAAEHQISPAQFEWTALNERAAAQAYADLESVFERVPTWHPLKQKQFHISFPLELAIWRLFELEAPSTVLYMFLSKMSNNSDKLQLAKRVKCVKGEIDALAGMKDVKQLTQLKDALPERSEEQFYCDKALRSLQNKRWSTDNIRLKL